MRKILLFISLLLITSCEKVIDIDLSFSNENYVIDAKIYLPNKYTLEKIIDRIYNKEKIKFLKS